MCGRDRADKKRGRGVLEKVAYFANKQGCGEHVKWGARVSDFWL